MNTARIVALAPALVLVLASVPPSPLPAAGAGEDPASHLGERIAGGYALLARWVEDGGLSAAGGEDAVLRGAVALAALARAQGLVEQPERGAEPLRRGREWLRATQRADGSFGPGRAGRFATWLAFQALASSPLAGDAAAAERAQAFLLERGLERAARILGAPPAGLARAVEFLGSSRTNAGKELAAGEDASRAGLGSRSPWPFDLRRAYHLLASRFEAAIPGFARSVDLPPEGTLGDVYLAARVLSTYGSPRLVTAGGETLYWPQALEEHVRRHMSSRGPGWCDEAGGEPSVTATALALLALEAILPWRLLSADALAQAEALEPRRYADLASDCAGCHRRLEPDLVYQWETSRHAARGVGCAGCHGENHSQTFRENGKVSARACAKCHAREAEEFAASRHARAMETLVDSALFAATPEASRSSCFGCHRVGETHADETTGSCNHCHSGHGFSARAAREPEACTICHTGEDYPQDLAFQRSKHGALYALTRDPRIAPSCATCHHPGGQHGDGFGITLGGSGSGGILEGEVAPIPMRHVTRQEYVLGRADMVSVCGRCHSSRFAEESLERADAIKREGDEVLRRAAEAIRELHAEGLIGGGPSDPLELGGEQVLVDPALPGGEVLNEFYHMWRFDYAATWKGAYHSSPSIANLQSRTPLARRLAALLSAAKRVRRERKEP